MTRYKQFENRKGGLIRLKTNILWIADRGSGDTYDSVCLIQDVDYRRTFTRIMDGSTSRETFYSIITLLLIDGSSKWVWVDEKDIEFIDDIV